MLPHIKNPNTHLVAGARMGYGGKGEDIDPLKLAHREPDGTAPPGTADGMQRLGTAGSQRTAQQGRRASVAESQGNYDYYDGDSFYDDYEDDSDGSETPRVRRGLLQQGQLLDQFDMEAELLLASIYVDRHKTFGFDEHLHDKEERKGLVAQIKGMWTDLLIPPAIQPHWEKEVKSIQAERAAEIKAQQAKQAAKWRMSMQDKGAQELEREKRLAELRKALRARDRDAVQFGKKKTAKGALKYPPPKKNLDYQRMPQANYEGGVFAGSKHGEGKQKDPSGQWYEGGWNMSRREGFGHLGYVDGSEYHGQFLEDEQHGLGVFRGNDGRVYKGEWKKGLRHGYGEMFDSKKQTIFSGQWEFGKKEGYGIFLWANTGNVYIGQWTKNLKDGIGVLRSDSAFEGIGRFFMRFNLGKLELRENYDTLKHGTDLTEAATWASHYAKAAAEGSDMVIKQKVAFPGLPDRGIREPDFVVAKLERESSAGSSVPAMRDGGENVEDTQQPLSLSTIDATLDEGNADSTKEKREDGEAVQDEKESKTRVPARMFRRLISLVHSSDPEVESYVLPILENSEEILDAPEGEEGFWVDSTIWKENETKLESHYARKIQWKWKNSGLKRMMKQMRLDKENRVETQSDYEARLKKDREIAKANREEALKKKLDDTRELNIDDLMLQDKPDVVSELAFATRRLFLMEKHLAPAAETGDNMLLHHGLVSKIYALRDSVKQLFGPLDRTARRRRSTIFSTSATVDEEEGQELTDELEIGSILLDGGVHYKGEVHGKIPTGYGVAKYPDGAEYQGMFRNGARHGLGVYYIRKQNEDDTVEEFFYYGEWLKGKRNGNAIEQTKNGPTTIKRQLLEYDMDQIIAFENIKEKQHHDWILACEEAASLAKRAQFEAQGRAPKGKKPTLVASSQVEFDSTTGLASYTGDFNDKGERNGLGIVSWHDGVEYAGKFKHGYMHGVGRESYPDGSVYLGQYKQGYRTGLGKYTNSDGVVYLGEWDRGMRHGHGIEKEEYQGTLIWIATVEYDEDKLMYLSSVNLNKEARFMHRVEEVAREAARQASKATPGTRIDYLPGNPEKADWYIGGTIGDKRSGLGVFVLKDSTRYIGEFFEDKKEGLGVETYPDKSMYTGSYMFGLRDGFGKYQHSSGLVFIGEWQKGKRHGRGVERVAINMATGVIYREFYVEYDRDKEKSRRILPSRKAPWMEACHETIEKAEKVAHNTVDTYKDLLD